MLRLFFGAQLGPEKCADLVLSAREAAEQRLVELGAARAELLEDTRLVADAPYVLLTIAAGEHSARAAITWADEALRELAKLARGE
ncbi:hypothetical protein [Mycetocola sp.]|uniref:hypothetical protein n=1 Tax=Mycetocola sp. TaxID=1871042 RepID=UPI003989D3CB